MTINDLQNIIIDNINTLLVKRKDISLKSLSHAIGTSDSYMQKLMSGNLYPIPLVQFCPLFPLFSLFPKCFSIMSIISFIPNRTNKFNPLVTFLVTFFLFKYFGNISPTTLFYFKTFYHCNYEMLTKYYQGLIFILLLLLVYLAGSPSMFSYPFLKPLHHIYS